MYGSYDRLYLAPVTRPLCLNLGSSGHRITQHSRTGNEPAKWMLGTVPQYHVYHP